MASTYNDDQQKAGGLGTDLSQSVTRTVSGNNAASGAPVAQASGKGAAASRDYGSMIGSYMGAVPSFQPSDNLTAAQNYLQQVTANKPGGYVSKYTSQLDGLYNQLLNRGPMQYDMNGDALYKQYQQRYTEAGKKSMRDAIGRASSMTGGYASSYAQTAGQDAYGEYMSKLQAAIPELANQAQQRYNDQTQMLQNRYNLVQQADQAAYGRYRDQVGDWQDERNYAFNASQQQYNNEYNRYSNDMNNAMQMTAWQREDASDDRSIAANQVNAMLSAGVKPTKALVEQSGLDYKQVMELYKKGK